jgi:hypothetical protein
VITKIKEVCSSKAIKRKKKEKRANQRRAAKKI